MKEIRLFLVLRSLDNFEFKKLEEMVYSPNFNKVENCIKLFEILKPFYPHFKDEVLTREFLFFKLFPEKKKITASINIYMSKLQDLAEEHLMYQELNKRFLYKKNLLLNAHLEKGLHKQFQSEYNETMNRFSNIKKRDATNFLEQFLIEKNYRGFQKSIKGRDQLSHPKITMSFLDSYYWIQKLTFACEEESYHEISSSEDLKEQELIISIKEGDKFLLQINEQYPQSHISQLFQKLLVCLQQPNNEMIFDQFLILFLNTDTKSVAKEEVNELFIHSINYCIDRIIKGKLEYKIKLFELYQLIVDFELIYENGYLNINRLKNIISCAVQVGKTEWAKQFLENYKHEIHPDQYNNAYHFNHAMIHFHSKKYEDAIKNLNRIETDIDKYYYLNRTTLLLRCYYEQKSPLAFENVSKTFRANVKRNKKLTPREKSSYGTFARIAFFLHQYRDGFSKKTKPKLLKMVDEATLIVHKQWLKEKLDQLK